MATRQEFELAIAVSGSTPYGYFDDKAKFVEDVEKFAVFARLKHGGATIGVELDDLDLISAYEEASIEYSTICNAAHARNTLPEYLGVISKGDNTSTSSNHYDDGTMSLLEHKFPAKTMQFLKRYTQAAADEAGGMGDYPVYTGTIAFQEGKQVYSLLTDLTGSSGPITGTMSPTIVRIYHDAPYYGIGTYAASVYFQRELSGASGGALPMGTMFGMFPLWPQILYAQNLDLSSRMRRSYYSYQIHGNDIWVTPVPSQNSPIVMRVEYQLNGKDPLNPPVNSGSVDKVSQFAEAPYGALDYSKLNSFSRNWIRKFAFAVSKETLGLKRSKFGSVKYVEGDMSLNGDALMSQAQEEKKSLREELQLYLETLSDDKTLERRSAMIEQVSKMEAEMPMGFLVG